MPDRNKALLGGAAEPGDTIVSQPLRFSSIGAYGSSIMAVAAVVVPAIKYLAGQQLNDTQLIAAAGILAVSILAFAIVSAGDGLARAYTAAWVVPKTEGDNNTPRPAILDPLLLAGVAKAMRAAPSAPANGHHVRLVFDDQKQVSLDAFLEALGVQQDELVRILHPQ